MTGFLLRIIINALALFWITTHIPGIFVDTLGSTLVGALILGLANAVVRPLFMRPTRRSRPAMVWAITVGINVILTVIMARTLPGVQVHGLAAALAAWVLLAALSGTLTRVIQDR